jgi:Heterokaryon incompatibility protein (HET)
MQLIYKSALRTIILLGPETPESTMAMELLEELNEQSLQKLLPKGDPEKLCEDERWLALGQDIMKRPWWDHI